VSREGAARQLLAAGATATIAALLLSLTGVDGPAAALFVLGVGGTLFGLHRVGRLGPA